MTTFGEMLKIYLCTVYAFSMIVNETKSWEAVDRMAAFGMFGEFCIQISKCLGGLGEFFISNCLFILKICLSFVSANAQGG